MSPFSFSTPCLGGLVVIKFPAGGVFHTFLPWCTLLPFWASGYWWKIGQELTWTKGKYVWCTPLITRWSGCHASYYCIEYFRSYLWTLPSIPLALDPTSMISKLLRHCSYTQSVWWWLHTSFIMIFHRELITHKSYRIIYPIMISMRGSMIAELEC